MKQSHYTTPRTMSEAEFQPWGEAVEGDNQGFDMADLIVMWACAGATLALAAFAMFGWLE